MTSTLIPSAIFSVQPARNARHVRGSRKGMSGGTMKRWSALYGYRVLISHGVTMRSAAQTESYPRASARRAASVRTPLAALPEIGRKTPIFTLALNATLFDGMSGDAPKTAFELAMERLRQKDREVGVEERPLTDEQKTSIAEVRRFYQAKVAEREILHRDALAKARSREEVEKLDGALRHDLERLTSDRDRKIDEIKKRPPTEH